MSGKPIKIGAPWDKPSQPERYLKSMQLRLEEILNYRRVRNGAVESFQPGDG